MSRLDMTRRIYYVNINLGFIGHEDQYLIKGDGAYVNEKASELALMNWRSYNLEASDVREVCDIIADDSVEEFEAYMIQDGEILDHCEIEIIQWDPIKHGLDIECYEFEMTAEQMKQYHRDIGINKITKC